MHALTSRPRQTPNGDLADRSERERKTLLPNRMRSAGASNGPGHDFGRTPLLPAPLGPQTSLTVSQPGDAHEREADSVAERVMRSPAPGKDCACGGKCDECAGGKPGGEEERVMRSSQETAGGASAARDASAVASPVGPALGGGRPLAESERAFFEPRFGWDFSRVRVHDGPQAAQSAESLGARAYTLGNDIAFNRGEYRPGTEGGRRLLAHELAHVVQQNTVIGRQVIQRDLLPRDNDCSNMTSLPVHEVGTSLARGVYYTQTFARPATGKVKVTAKYPNDTSCPPGSTFGVNMWQCHIASDEALEEQHISPVGTDISYTIDLPTAKWNTYEKYTLRLRVNCDSNDVDIKIEA